ncbi:MAG: hypothetical protein L0H94_02905 [Nitrospira sp.]|nr:hypothetical protein [Nitrospira sp.]
MKARVMIAVMAMGLWAMGLVGSPSAKAVSLDFSINAPSPGSISSAGGGAPLIGSNIEVDKMIGLSTPANAGIEGICLSCTLNFTTGGLTSSGGGTWNFGAGGTVTITGGAQLPGAPNIALGSTLLSGTFNSAAVQDLGFQQFMISFGTFFDSKHPDLLAYYSLIPGTPFEGAFSLLFNSPDPAPNGAFASTTIFSGNVVNAVVPLPAAVLLFGSGLAGLLTARGRRLFA